MASASKINNIHSSGLGATEEIYEQEVIMSLKNRNYIDAALLSEEVGFRFMEHLPKLNFCMNRAINILDHVYGDENPKKSIIYYTMAVFSSRQEMREESGRYYELARTWEENYHYNPLLLGRVYFELGLINNYAGSLHASY